MTPTEAVRRIEICDRVLTDMVRKNVVIQFKGLVSYRDQKQIARQALRARGYK